MELINQLGVHGVEAIGAVELQDANPSISIFTRCCTDMNYCRICHRSILSDAGPDAKNPQSACTSTAAALAPVSDGIRNCFRIGAGKRRYP